jgi:hypothetical protein
MNNSVATPPPFDLNIENYTLREIERFFGLKIDKTYKRQEIEDKEYRIREQLLKSGHVDKRLKADLIYFLSSAKKWLIDEKTKPVPVATTLPQNYPLDKMEIPPLKPIVSRENEIVQHPTTQYVYTQPSQYFSGIINPLDKRILTKTLVVDTKYRQNYGNTVSTDFLLQLPDRFVKVVSMELSSVEIPTTFYNITSSLHNNYFSVVASLSTGESETFLVVVPDGNYTGQGLTDTLNGMFANQSTLFACLSWSIDTTADGTGTGKTILTTNDTVQPFDNIVLDFSLDAEGNMDKTIAPQSKMGWMMGFTQIYYSGSLNYVSDSPLWLNNMNTMYLSIDDYNNNVNNGFVSAFQNSVLNSNVLARIGMCNMENKMVVKENVAREYFGPVVIQKMQIRLYDAWGRTVNLNCKDFSFCLILKTMYDL